MRAILAWACLVSVAITGLSCSSSDEHAETATLFFKRHQDGQVVPVLAPTEREKNVSPTAQAVVRDLLAGPTEGERDDGFRPAFPPGVHVLSVRRVGSTQLVDVAGLAIDDFYAAAATVYTLTELPGIEAVSLRVEGRPCCVYDQQSKPIDPLRRAMFYGWPGEPCDLRTYHDAVGCGS